MIAATAPGVLRNPLFEPQFSAPKRPSPRWFHRRLPGYAPTPLHDVAAIAQQLGLGRVLVKDESSRLGLPAFKMLGASWASYRALCERLGRDPGEWGTEEDLARALAPLRPLTLATATDGNHGRAVARIARMLGFSSRIWVPSNTAQARIDAIVDEGAEVIVSSGGYDQAVAESAAAADDSTLIVSDTSWPGYESIPAWVIDGYSTILDEVDEQVGAMGIAAPDAVVVPIGVGAFAAAVAGHYRAEGAPRPILVGVEPVDAACIQASAEAGEIVTLEGEQLSIMAGLNCGTPSRVAWPTVSRSYAFLTTVSDGQAVEAMRTLARNGIESGESGAASLAGLDVLVTSGKCPELGADATVVLISTEGVTNPEFYRREVFDAL